MKSFENKTAIVTGGAAGIGRALCEQLAGFGSRVVIADINGNEAARVAALIQQRGGQAEAVQVDVSNAIQIETLVSDIVAKHGHLDFMFNNAAIAAVGELRDGNIEDFRRVVDVNLFGVVHGTMAAYRVMLRQGGGHIINMSSVTGLIPSPLLTGYSTTKCAIIGFSNALRAEAIALGVRVSVACPGLVRTDIGERNLYWNVRKEDHLKQLPLRWAIDPDDAARSILRGVARDQQIIVFPFSVRLAWWMYRACPCVFAPLLQSMLKRFRLLRIKP